jgi:type III secretion system HrpE/YscL family protein
MPGKIIKGDALPSAEPIERSPAARPRAAVVESDVYDAHQRAKEIVEHAGAEASRIREEAEKGRVQVYEKAKNDGYQAGLSNATEILAKAHRERGNLLAAAEADLVKLSVKIAEKIIVRELAQSPETIVSICSQAIENLRAQRELILRVHPEDAAILRNSRKRLMDLVGRLKDLAIKEDPEIARGGCIIESESGATIDAQLSTQLEMIQRALLGEDGASGFAKGAEKP